MSDQKTPTVYTGDDMTVSLKTRQAALIAEAKKRHKKIKPLKYNGGFTTEDGRLIFWYNTPNGSTHIAVEGKKNDHYIPV
jgi:hypothetical protein